MKKPIFILGCSKSGTSLLRNLLDGHPDLFVVPTEAHFFQNTKYWVNYAFRSTRPRQLTIKEKKSELLNWIQTVNSVEDSVSDAFTKGRWQVKRVEQVLNDGKARTDKELMNLYVKAMYSGLYGKNMPEHLRLVEKSVENAEFALELWRMYPDARFVHIVRNPYSNMVALRKYVQYTHHKESFPYLKNVLLSLYNSFYFLHKNQGVIPNYFTVKYEDILMNPEETVRQLADFLEIGFIDLLLQPTMFSEAWQGNSSRQTRFSSISADNLDRWKAEITSLELWIINHFFSHTLNTYSYEYLLDKGGLYKRVPKESPAIYLQNRIFLKMVSNF